MTDNSNLPAVVQPPASRGLLASEERFEFGQRAAKLFAASQLVPQHLRGNVSDCFIGLHMAERLNEDPLVVLQNIVIIKGNAGWKAQYMIARANASGVFKGRIKWRVAGAGPTLSVVAHATMADTGEEVESPTVDMAMAKAEGWTSNSKYTSMPEVMLRYRSAAFLVRFNCPEVMLGMQTAEEIEDVVLSGRGYIDGGDAQIDPANMDAFERAAAGVKPAEIEHKPATDAPAPTEAPKRRGRPPNPKPTETPQPEPAVTQIEIADANGEIGTFPDDESAVGALRGLVNSAATEGDVIAIRNANGAFLGAHQDLAQTVQNRMNGFAEKRVMDERAADIRRDAEQDNAAPAPQAAPTASSDALSVILKTKGVAETKDGPYQYDLPDQIEEYEADFKTTFLAHAAVRDINAFNAAVKEHQPEVDRLNLDPRFAELLNRLRAHLQTAIAALRKPRPVGGSDMH